MQTVLSYFPHILSSLGAVVVALLSSPIHAVFQVDSMCHVFVDVSLSVSFPVVTQALDLPRVLTLLLGD